MFVGQVDEVLLCSLVFSALALFGWVEVSKVFVVFGVEKSFSFLVIVDLLSLLASKLLRFVVHIDVGHARNLSELGEGLDAVQVEVDV